MAFFKSKKQRNPQDLVRTLKDSLITVGGADKRNAEKATEEISKVLGSMKALIYGDEEHEPNVEATVQLANEIYSSDVLPLLVTNLGALEFEARKDLCTIFNNLLRRQIGPRFPTVEYICREINIIEMLLRGYASPEIALSCGLMLREVIKHEPLARLVLQSEQLWNFFQFIEMPHFDVASDAFATFRELLVTHKPLVAEFLERNYENFIDKYTVLLNSQNYVTRRQSLKLLGELLLERTNFNIMTKYISSSQNLRLVMNLLRDKSRNIQFEAFHVFKVFVANPNKPRPIIEILQRNKDKLLAFLTTFHNDKDDEQFNDEKAFLMKQIQAIPIDS